MLRRKSRDSRYSPLAIEVPQARDDEPLRTYEEKLRIARELVGRLRDAGIVCELDDDRRGPTTRLRKHLY